MWKILFKGKQPAWSIPHQFITATVLKDSESDIDRCVKQDAPVSEVQLKALVDKLFEKTQVLYPPKASQIVPTTKEVVRLGRQQTQQAWADSARDIVVEQTIAEESLGNPDDVTAADRSSYWETRDRINTISAIPPS
ncbi:MAG: hypothetical protein LQ351_003494 [Letrouitia transgressa]|nr:MAG: hypothetical protein LQ351_003494 [Letrouitia transgressa]